MALRGRYHSRISVSNWFGGDDPERIDGGRTGIAVVDQLPSCFNLRNRFSVLILAFSVVSVIIHFWIDSAESRRQFFTDRTAATNDSFSATMMFVANHDLCSYGSILRLIALVVIRLDRCSAWISSLCGFGAHMIMSFAIIAFARSNAKTIARIC